MEGGGSHGGVGAGREAEMAGQWTKMTRSRNGDCAMKREKRGGVPRSRVLCEMGTTQAETLSAPLRTHAWAREELLEAFEHAKGPAYE